MEGNVKKPRKKVGLKPFGEVANFAEPPHFFRKTFFKGSLEKFLRIQQPCCMYLEGCSRVALYNGSKIMIIRLTNQKIWKETYKKTTKYKPSLCSTVSMSTVKIIQTHFHQKKKLCS